MSLLRPEVALAGLTDRVRFVVLDVETTTSDGGDRIVSGGVVQVSGRGAALVEPIEWFCPPGVPIENTHFHGVTEADVAGQAPFSARIDELAAVLRTAPAGPRVVLVAHNAQFDVGVLHLEHQRSGRSLADVAVLDTLAVARYLKLGTGGYSLPKALAHFGLTVTKHHNALADATDTAALLQRLLQAAARDGHTDLDNLLAAAQPGRVRTSGYPTRSATRTTRARARSPFTFIDRPASHPGLHKAMPKQATEEQIDDWLAGLRECVTLRCPLLADKTGRLATGRERVLTGLLDDLTDHLAAGRTVDANTTLGAVTTIAVRHLRAAETAAFHDERAALFSATTRCGAGATSPFDACPECRADRACPADIWPQAIAVALTGAQRNLNSKTATVWLGPTGRLSEHASTRPSVAAHAAWLISAKITAARPDDALELAHFAERLGLLEPRLVHQRARTTAEAGDLPAAIAALTTALSARAGSTDRAWADLAAYRDALTARHTAAQRPRPVRPFRLGHSAPATRPTRRRFTGQAATVQAGAKTERSDLQG